MFILAAALAPFAESCAVTDFHREAELSGNPIPKAADDVEREKLERAELVALLRDVIEQRDKVLAQYEAMALQVNESTGEIGEAKVEAEVNAERADDNARRAEWEAARARELSRALDEERRRGAEIAAAFSRFREATEHAPVEDPWGVLGHAISQILENWIVWLRAKIPPGSPLLPWFDRAVALMKAAGRLALKWGTAFFAWTKPRVLALWKWLRSEVARRMGKE